MNWIDTVAGGFTALETDISTVKTRLDRAETWIAQRGDPDPDPPDDLEAAKQAARQAVAEPEPTPQPGDERQARTAVEMVEAILSNLTLTIEADGLAEAVRYAKQAQRWALILRKAIRSA